MRLIPRILVALFLLCLWTTRDQAQTELKPPPRANYKYDGKIVTANDKEKDRTIVLIQLMRVKDVEDPRPVWEHTASKPRDQESLSFTMFFAYPGEKLVTPEYVSIGFTYLALYPQRYDDHLLSAKIDGQWIALGKMRVMETHEVTVRFIYKRYTHRVLELVLPYEHLLRLANAKKVTMKIGGVEFGWSKDHLTAVRDLASRSVP